MIMKKYFAEPTAAMTRYGWPELRGNTTNGAELSP